MKKNSTKIITLVLCITLLLIGYKSIPRIKHHFKKSYIVFRPNVCFNQNDTTNFGAHSRKTYMDIKNGTAHAEGRPGNEIQFTDFVDYEASLFDNVSLVSISPRNSETGMQPIPFDTSTVGENFTRTIYYSYGDGRYSSELTYAVKTEC